MDKSNKWLINMICDFLTFKSYLTYVAGNSLLPNTLLFSLLSKEIRNMIPCGNGPDGIWTRGLLLARQALSPWATGPLLWVMWLWNLLLIFYINNKKKKGGDPAVGSPTATLWRLNPPHRIWVWYNSKLHLTQTQLGWFDGRCVQRAGTYSPGRDETRLLGIPLSWGWITILNLNLDKVSRFSSAFRRGSPLSLPLLRACSPADSEHTDLPWPTPSSPFPGQSP